MQAFNKFLGMIWGETQVKEGQKETTFLNETKPNTEEKENGSTYILGNNENFLSESGKSSLRQEVSKAPFIPSRLIEEGYFLRSRDFWKLASHYVPKQGKPIKKSKAMIREKGQRKKKYQVWFMNQTNGNSSQLNLQKRRKERQKNSMKIFEKPISFLEMIEGKEGIEEGYNPFEE